MPEKEINRLSGTNPKFFYGYIILISAFIIQVVMFGPRASFGVFFKPMITEFGWTRALTSGAYSISSFMQGFMGVAMGSLNDKFGPRAVMTLCGFLTGLGFMLMSQINSAWQFYLFYVVLVGIGMGGMYAPPLSTLAKWFVKRRSMMSGIAVAGGGVGGLLLPPLANWIISSYGWRSANIILGAIILVIVILAAQFLRRDPAQMGLSPYGQAERGEPELSIFTEGFSLREAVQTGQFWMTAALLFCFGFCILTTTIHIVPHTTDLGISAATAANVLALLNGIQFVGGITLGIIGDRIGNKKAYAISMFLLTLSIFLLLYIREVWMFYLVMAFAGIGGGGGATLTSPLTASLFGIKSHGLILGIILLCATVGAAAGPYLAGYLFDLTESYNIAFIISAALGAISIILAATLKPINKCKQ